MITKPKFSAANSLGSKDEESILMYLREIESTDKALSLMSSRGGAEAQFMGNPFSSNAWKQTGMAVGYIAPNQTIEKANIISAMTMKADQDLIDKRIKITLDKFYVHEYPGLGAHRILCDFTGKNYVSSKSTKVVKKAEELRFSFKIEANDRSGAAISGHPIFVGVVVGSNGLSFEGRTINLGSKNDEAVNKLLHSSVFKNGLSLLSSAQPALIPFVGLTTSLVEHVVSKSQNVQIHNFHLGLDFGENVTSAKLKCGSYVVVQTDGHDLEWRNKYWCSNSQSVRCTQSNDVLELNYLVFGVTAHTDCE